MLYGRYSIRARLLMLIFTNNICKQVQPFKTKSFEWLKFEIRKIWNLDPWFVIRDSKGLDIVETTESS